MKRRDLRVVRGDNKYTFSAGVVVESLQGIGVSTDEAINMARKLERHYRTQNKKHIALGDLVEQLSSMIEASLGQDLAQRFRQQTPPFVPIIVATDEGRNPFSRRTLANSLEKLGISFKEAYAVARQVEQTLRTEGYETVSKRQLAHQAALCLEASLGRETRIRYESKTNQLTDLMVIEPDGIRFPYSRGILAQSLMAVGLGPELSHHLAKRAEDVLWRMGKAEVDRATVRRVVKSLLLQEAGEEFARRYELMKSVRRPERPIILLIGGAPGVGKSTLSSELAYRLGIPRLVSSDAVRQALRSLISEELSPALHSSSYTAWRAELLPSEQERTKPKRKRVIRGFQRQVQQLSTALMAILNRSVEEATSLVVEGIHLVPGFMPLDSLDAVVVELVLAVNDPQQHRSYFEVREVQTRQRRSRERYLSHFQEIRILHDFAVDRAKQLGIPIIDTSDIDQSVDQAIECVLSAVLMEHGESNEERRELADAKQVS